MSHDWTRSKLLIVVTMLNVSIINIISIKSIDYNITLILIYVLIYVYLKNKYSS